MATNLSGLLLSGLLATSLIAAPYAALAQDAPKADSNVAAASEATGKPAEPKADRPLTAQQLKLKECGARWQEEKKTKGVKGRDAWNKFRSDCLKADAAATASRS